MRIAFAGTPEFARVALERLHGAGFDVALVLTQPDRPAGRGLRMQASPVKAFATAHGIEVAQPRGLRLDGRYGCDARAAQAALLRAAPDVVVVAAFGLILPPWLLALPRHGCLNIHASLLPRWRGAAPIQRAIEAGDDVTGVTIMQMDAGLDTGAVLLARPLAIAARDSAASLESRLAELGTELAEEALHALERDGRSPPGRPQPAEGVTYAAKIAKHEALIDWREPAATVERRLRAFDPFPGARGTLGGETILCWRATAQTSPLGAPGEVLGADANALTVACGTGSVAITELQRPGGRRLAAGAFLRGRSPRLGALFDAKPPVA